MHSYHLLDLLYHYKQKTLSHRQELLQNHCNHHTRHLDYLVLLLYYQTYKLMIDFTNIVKSIINSK